MTDTLNTSLSRGSVGLIDELFSQAKREKQKILPTWQRYYRMVRNQVWSQYRSPWLPSPSSSEIYPTFATLVAWMTDQRPDFQVLPFPDLAEFGPNTPQVPQILNERSNDMADVLDWWWLAQKVSYEVQCSMWDALSFGCGIMRTGFDESMWQGLGEATLRRTDPFSILPDPQASSLDDARYILEVRRVPFFEIKQRFPERANYVPLDAGREDDAPKREKVGFMERLPLANLRSPGVTGEFPGTNTPGLPAMYGPPGSSAQDYTRSVLLKECWIRTVKRVEVPLIEGQDLRSIKTDLPIWEYMASAGGVDLVSDTSNPFNHGRCPYIRIPMVENGEFWSIPLAEHLMPVQIAMNRILAAMQINAELTGNPILKEGKGTGISRSRIMTRPGQRIQVNDNAFDKLEWLQPPQVGATMYQLLGFYRDTIDRISGIAAIRGGQLRKNTPGEAVDAVQEASFVRIRSVMRNMEDALQEGISQVTSNICQFYCVSDDTDALTRDGWKSCDEIHAGDELLTYNVESEVLEWQRAECISVFPFEGKLHNVRGFLATEDHRWPVKRQNRKRTVVKRGYDLCSQDRLIQAATGMKFDEDSLLSPREAAVLGWLVTDGHIRFTKKNTINAVIVQSGKKYLRELISLLGNDTTGPKKTTVEGCFTLYLKSAFVRSVLEKCDYRSKDDLLRIVPRLSLEAAESMWDAMFKAEGCVIGHHKGVMVAFSQKHGPVFDAFQMLSLFFGHRVNRGVGKNHIVSGFGMQHSGRYICAQEIPYEFYEGRVWCPTTLNGTWVARRNGKIIITGNTEPRSVPLVEPEGDKTFKLLGPRYFHYPKLNAKGEPGDEEPMRFNIRVEAGSSQPISRNAKMAEYDNLFAMGAIGLRTLLQRGHGMVEVDDIIGELSDQMTAGLVQDPNQEDQRIRRT